MDKTGKTSTRRASHVEDMPTYGFEPFQVTCVIGEVYPSETGEPSDIAAYRLISQHDAPGTYSFPNHHGGVTTVTIDPNAS